LNDAEINGARRAIRRIDYCRVIDKHVEPLTMSPYGGCSCLNRFLSIKIQFDGMNIEVLSPELLRGCLAGGDVPRAKKDQKSGLSQLPGDF
jgi:hypothetical protein